MSVARSLERRLERLLDGLAGRVFSGRLHPSELAGKLAREADFARFDHPAGPATANLFVIRVNPRDLSVDVEKLQRMLAAEMSAYTAEEGLRLEGPIEVRITPNEDAAPGRTDCHVEVKPGPGEPWAQLSAADETYLVDRNRTLVGRSPEHDLVIPHDDISRTHALIFRERGQAYIKDLGSANGTAADGAAVGSEPVSIDGASTIRLGEHRYRFLEL